MVWAFIRRCLLILLEENSVSVLAGYMQLLAKIKSPAIKAGLITGGDDRDRTGDLRRARAALSQLSYIPRSMLKLNMPEKLKSIARLCSPYEYILPCTLLPVNLLQIEVRAIVVLLPLLFAL